MVRCYSSSALKPKIKQLQTVLFYVCLVIRHEAGRAELGLTVTSPSGRSVPYEINMIPGGDHVTYIPMEPGPHHIYITYGGLDVPGTVR